jgi:quercetin dioxygenase-like cupin family protein
MSEMVGGWFIGDFTPSVLQTSGFEVGVKSYDAGTIDPEHYHKVATEVTVIVSGRARMGDLTIGSGDIVIVEPEDVVRFEAITDVTLVVVKMPSAKGDKFLTSPAE